MGRRRKYPKKEIFAKLDELYAETKERPTLDALEKRASGACRGTLSRDRREWIATNFPDHPPLPETSEEFQAATETYRREAQIEVGRAQARGRLQAAEEVKRLEDNVASLEDETDKLHDECGRLEEENETVASNNSRLVYEWQAGTTRSTGWNGRTKGSAGRTRA